MDAKLDFAESALTEIFGDDVVADGAAFLKGRLRFLHSKKIKLLMSEYIRDFTNS
jgi:hypothetical protein